MSGPTPASPRWLAANQRSLTRELTRVCAIVAHRLGVDSPALHASRQPVGDDEPLSPPSALATLCAAFELSPFERDLLLLCAGVEMSSEVVTLLRTAHGDDQRSHVTFGLALALLSDAHWSAITPAAPLRRERLIDVQPGEALTQAVVRIDERALHHLAGLADFDERFLGLVTPVTLDPSPLPPSLRTIVDRLVRLWRGPMPGGATLQLCGDDAPTRQLALAAACDVLGLRAYALRAADLPPLPQDRQVLAATWAREAKLGAGPLLIECDDDIEQSRLTASFVHHAGGRIAVSVREPLRLAGDAVHVDVQRPTSSEQRALWQHALGHRASAANGMVDRIVAQFALGPGAIATVAATVAQHMDSSQAHDVDTVLWEACRARARLRLDDLAQRLPVSAAWDDLVLPPPQMETLGEILAHVRHRTRVYDTWGFARRGGRGLGISALFAGASGTGKTMAAEVIADALRLDLYRIDLSQVVSKYIGETEKHLRRVFDAAESSGAVLLFDEADALFGKRSEVRDSHDRYANIEVSYLLQRMETYRGLAILTTNLKNALDTAFVRRLRFIVQFPFPDVGSRREMWRRAFPADAPSDGLDPDKLARLGVPGGNIRNIALHAAFLAADLGQQLTMAHVLRAARSEYAKMEKPLTESEIGGWT